MRPSGDWQGDGLAHEAFVFGDDRHLVDRCVPFVREGLERGEAVLVVASAGVRDLLCAALGSDSDRLATVGAAETWWRGTGFATLHAYHRDLHALARQGRPWRLVAEPVWLAEPAGRLWSRFEAVANRCYADYPYYSLCLHDARRLPGDVFDAVLRTHPETWGGDGPRPSPRYEDPEAFLRAVEPAWSPRPADVTPVETTDVRRARAAVRDAVTAAGWAARLEEITLALHELVANALRVAGAADVSAWRDDGSLVVEVADRGPGLDDPTAGYVPPDPGAEIGRGLWIARSLADDATIRPTDPGTAVRLFFRRP